MAINGDFRNGNSLYLQDEEWFDTRFEKELGAIFGADLPPVTLVDICESSRFLRPNYLAVQLLLGSRRFEDVSYGVELVCPKNWPWGEPVSYVEGVTAGMSLPGGYLPHIYTDDVFRDCLCTHVSGWDTIHGKSTLAAYLVACSTWLTCFERWLELDGALDYRAWSDYARTVMR